MIIRRIGVLSAAKIGAILGAAIGLLAGLMFFLVSSIGGAAGMDHPTQSDPGMAWMAGLGALAIVALPIIYAIFGFLGGAIQAFIYNLAAKYVGGLVIETE